MESPINTLAFFVAPLLTTLPCATTFHPFCCFPFVFFSWSFQLSYHLTFVYLSFPHLYPFPCHVICLSSFFPLPAVSVSPHRSTTIAIPDIPCTQIQNPLTWLCATIATRSKVKPAIATVESCYPIWGTLLQIRTRRPQSKCHSYRTCYCYYINCIIHTYTS